MPSEALAGRRGLIAGLAGVMATASEPALASGGSTAGKYSTIPSAKKRFYGRVRQGIYQYLKMEKPILDGDLENQAIKDLYGKSIITQVGGKQIKNCNPSFGGECVTREKRTSRWNDFKTASDLLASAFRYSADDVNDYLPQVKLIRAYAKKVDKMKEAVKDGNVGLVQELYAKTKLDLDRYLPMVELEPLASEDYTHQWDERPEVWCQGSFCVS